jgi:hypothetical protein
MKLLIPWFDLVTPRGGNDHRYPTPYTHNWNLRTNDTVNQGVTKRCRLSWLTNSPLVYEPKCGGKLRGTQPMMFQGAQINFRDLTTYLTYAIDCLQRTSRRLAKPLKIVFGVKFLNCLHKNNAALKMKRRPIGLPFS